MRTALSLGILALGAGVHADPLDLDFGPPGPGVHEVGAVGDGVNIVRFGNLTGAGIPVHSAVTFSVPQGLQVDRMTLTMLSYSSSYGALLRASLLTPNGGEVLGFRSESEFVGLAINDPSAVTASFRVTPHPDFGGTVDAYLALADSCLGGRRRARAGDGGPGGGRPGRPAGGAAPPSAPGLTGPDPPGRQPRGRAPFEHDRH